MRSGYSQSCNLASRYMRLLLLTLLFLGPMACYAQENGFPYGKATYRELEITEYASDTAAAALVLDEFGEAFIKYDSTFSIPIRQDQNLKTEGLRQGTLRFFCENRGSRRKDYRGESIFL